MVLAKAYKTTVRCVYVRPDARRTPLARRLIDADHLGQTRGAEDFVGLFKIRIADQAQRWIDHTTQRLERPGE